MSFQFGHILVVYTYITPIHHTLIQPSCIFCSPKYKYSRSCIYHIKNLRIHRNQSFHCGLSIRLSRCVDISSHFLKAVNTAPTRARLYVSTVCQVEAISETSLNVDISTRARRVASVCILLVYNRLTVEINSTNIIQ